MNTVVKKAITQQFVPISVELMPTPVLLNSQSLLLPNDSGDEMMSFDALNSLRKHCLKNNPMMGKFIVNGSIDTITSNVSIKLSNIWFHVTTSTNDSDFNR